MCSSDLSCFLCRISSHCKKVHLALIYCSKDNDALAKLLFQLVTKITKSVHVNALYLGSKEFHTFYFYNLIHNISQSTLSQFALQTSPWRRATVRPFSRSTTSWPQPSMNRALAA